MSHTPNTHTHHKNKSKNKGVSDERIILAVMITPHACEHLEFSGRCVFSALCATSLHTSSHTIRKQDTKVRLYVPEPHVNTLLILPPQRAGRCQPLQAARPPPELFRTTAQLPRRILPSLRWTPPDPSTDFIPLVHEIHILPPRTSHSPLFLVFPFPPRFVCSILLIYTHCLTSATPESFAPVSFPKLLGHLLARFIMPGRLASFPPHSFAYAFSYTPFAAQVTVWSKLRARSASVHLWPSELAPAHTHGRRGRAQVMKGTRSIVSTSA